MRVRTHVAAPHLYPSDSTRHLPIRAGMGGLRHKPRHKIPRGWGGPPELSSRVGPVSPETPFHPLEHPLQFLFFQEADHLRIASGSTPGVPR